MQEKEQTINMLFGRYKTMELSPKQVSEITNKSTTTLARWREKGFYLNYHKIEGPKNGTVTYNLFDVVDYLCRSKTIVI